jgi:predicted helicase
MSLRERYKAFKTLISSYLSKLREVSQDADASQELSLRPALNILVEGLNDIFTHDDLKIVTEPLRKSFGTPDYKLKTSQGYLIGYIEAKGLGAHLPEIEQTEQIERYRSSGKRFVLTNHLEFILFDYASDGKAIVRADSVRLLSEKAFRKGQPPQDANVEALYRLFDRFLKEARPDISTPKELAERLAASARHIRDLLIEAYAAEGESGDLHNLKAAFEETLLPDLTPEQFADMYAQTLTYGLFAARVNHRGPELLTLDNAWHDIPKTNPFLRTLFESVTGSALEDKPYRWVIEDLVHLLNALDMHAILEGFGKRTAQQDPIVHFYEDFLAEYDPELREKRGVYYTPEPVVSFIVRSVDHLLKERFGLAEGLADRSTVTYTVKRNGKEYTEKSHKVLILDPACGTGTFLYFVVDLIRRRFMERREAGMWQGYVRDHLLPRIFGFELLMAPYAMAHLKLGMQLAGFDLPESQRKDWAYAFDVEERLGIYMTNTLEEPRPLGKPFPGFWRVIAQEANAAAHVKRDLPILVVLGNPPYSGHSANKGPWIDSLLKGSYYYVDGQPLGEKNPKWLQDDYVKFIRWGQWRIEQSGAGILAFITNHGYLDNPTFRGMREKLLKSFSEIYLLNLHGNAKKRERVPEDVQRALGIGEQDENVFDIQQGVAIGIFVKEPEKSGPAKVFYADLWGVRERKYQWLLEHDVNHTEWEELSSQAPFYLFVPQERARLADHESGWKITEIMPVNSVGIVTSRDDFVFDFDKTALEGRIKDFLNPRKSDQELRNYLRDKDKLDVSKARQEIQKASWSNLVVQCLYRPFDTRYLFYHDAVIERSRRDVMRHMLAGENLALITSRLTKGETFKHVQVTRRIVEVICMSPKTSNNGFVFPLYLYPTESEIEAGTGVARSRMIKEAQKALEKKTETKDLTKEQDRIEGLIKRLFPQEYYPRWPNLNPDFIDDVSQSLGLRFVPEGRGDLKETFGPEDAFHYIYAVLHSPTYRERYKEFLRIDFPRIPLTSDLELFEALCQKGADLVALHLLEPSYGAASWNRDKAQPNPFHNVNVRYPVPGDDVAEKGHPKYIPPGERTPGSREPLQEGRVYINRGQYFEGVPPEVWEFHVGGYQVCEKWLKDRRGRKLSYDDKEHYKKIVMALGETIRLMREIDEVIEQHGGWPIQ